MDTLPQQVRDLSAKVDALQQQLNDLIRFHTHDGTTASRVNLLDVLFDMKRPTNKNQGIFQVVSVAPATAPNDPFDQIQVYVNATTYRLYWYDWNAAVWHYVTATA